MDDFYLKYESQYRTKVSCTDVKEVLSKWVLNLSEEIDIISLFNNQHTHNRDNDKEKLNGLTLFFASLIDISNQFKEYSIELDKGINVLSIMKEDNDDYDSLVNSLFSFLKDNYNSILILIEQFYSLNHSLIPIRNFLIKSIKSNKEIKTNYNKPITILTMTQSQLDQLSICTKDIRESQLRQANLFIRLKDKGYPSIKEINRLSDQMAKGSNAGDSSNHYQYDNNHLYDKHYGMRGLGVNVTQCRDICLEIQENLKRYCVCFSHPQGRDETKMIKAENSKIEDKLTLIKVEVKNYVKGLKEINERIDKFNKENKSIVALNNNLHGKINNGHCRDNANDNGNNEYIKWKTKEQSLPYYSHSNKENNTMMLFNSKFLTQTQSTLDNKHHHNQTDSNTDAVARRYLLKRID